MGRNIVADDLDARAELGANRKFPQWREARRELPFVELSGDDFEILCFLLLRKEYPGEKIYYYGKTADAGRDIIHKRPDGTVCLIQCKRYSINVGVKLLRAEFAKLFTNIFSGTIPERPDEIVFYVVPDITSPAASLFEKQSNWRQAATQAIRKHVGKDVPAGLIDFAAQWWPTLDRDNAVGLTARIERFSDLRDEFFAVRKVIDASRKDVKRDIHKAVKPVDDKLNKLLSNPLFAEPLTGSNPKMLLLAIASRLASGLGLNAALTSAGVANMRSAEPSQQFDSSSHEITLLIESRVASELGSNLNLTPTSVLQAMRSHEPPPLPSAHVERRDAVELIETCLREASVLAVTGYAESGKTIALAEFARLQQCDCLWFSAPLAVRDKKAIALLYCFYLSVPIWELVHLVLTRLLKNCRAASVRSGC